MSYNKTNWQAGMILTANELNKIEEAIENLNEVVDNLSNITTIEINKVNIVNNESTNDQVPSAKAVWDLFTSIEDSTNKQY